MDVHFLRVSLRERRLDSCTGQSEEGSRSRRTRFAGRIGRATTKARTNACFDCPLHQSFTFQTSDKSQFRTHNAHAQLVGTALSPSVSGSCIERLVAILAWYRFADRYELLRRRLRSPFVASHVAAVRSPIVLPVHYRIYFRASLLASFE